MPIRPAGTPTWLQILDQSSRTTQAAFDTIGREMEQSRAARFQAEQAKQAAMESAVKIKQDDRMFNLREKELNWRMDQSIKADTVDRIKTSLDIESRQFEMDNKRLSVLKDTLISPIKAEVDSLKFDISRQDEYKDKLAKLSEAEKAVAPILQRIIDIPSYAQPEETEPYIAQQMQEAGKTALDIYGPVNADNVLSNTKKYGEIRIPGQGPQQLDSSLFPDNIISNQVNRNSSSATLENAPDGTFGQRNGLNAVDVTDDGSFDFGQARSSETVLEYPPTSNPRSQGQATQGSELNNPKVGPALENVKPVVTPQIVDGVHFEVERLRNAAEAEGKLTPELLSSYSQHIDKTVGPENNRYRQQAMARLDKLAELDDDKSARFNATVEDAKIWMGGASAIDYYTNKKLGVEDRYRAKGEAEKEAERLAQIEKDRKPQPTVDDQRKTITDRVNSLRLMLDQNLDISDDAKIKIKNQIDKDVDALVSLGIPSEEAESTGSLNDLILSHAFGGRRDPSTISNSSFNNEVAASTNQGRTYINDQNQSVRRINPSLQKKVEESKFGSITDTQFGEIIKNKLQTDGGLSEEEVVSNFDLSGVDENSDDNVIYSKITQGFRVRANKKWDELSPEQKKTYSNNKTTLEKLKHKDFIATGLGLEYSAPKATAKDLYIQEQLSRSNIREVSTRVIAATKENAKIQADLEYEALIN